MTGDLLKWNKMCMLWLSALDNAKNTYLDMSHKVIPLVIMRPACLLFPVGASTWIHLQNGIFSHVPCWRRLSLPKPCVLSPSVKSFLYIGVNLEYTLLNVLSEQCSHLTEMLFPSSHCFNWYLFICTSYFLSSCTFGQHWEEGTE